jgi:hypothetical protein
MNFLNPSILTRNIFHLFIAFALSHTLSSQILPNRYEDQIFVSVIETQGVRFSTNVPQPKVNWFHPYVFLSGLPVVVFEDDFNYVNLEMDVFEPQGDTMEVRPLVIVAFGGGFVDDTRKDWDIRLLCENLARRGYVTASIDYRLGMNVLDEELSKRAVYRGVQDARSAVRFFKQDASNNNTFRVDTNQIFLGGHSSGGFIALHTAYIDKDSERPRSTKDSVDMTGQTIYEEMGCLDCVGNNPEYVGDVKAIFNLAGAIGDTLYMESSSDLPVISFHSEDDDTVPYDVGEPFDNVPLVSFNLPLVMGSSPTHRYADQLGIINEFYSYTNLGHSIHHNGISLYPYIVPNISNFFYEHCLKPEDLSITGNQVFCTTDNIQNYQAIGGNPKYYDWEVTGGSILSPSIYSSSTEVGWDPSAPLHELKVTPYSSNGAGGNQISMSINVTSGNQVEWTTASGDWNDENNWNLNRMPLSCDDVLINSAVAMDVLVLPGTTIEVKSLTLQGPINLDITSSSTFIINND